MPAPCRAFFEDLRTLVLLVPYLLTSPAMDMRLVPAAAILRAFLALLTTRIILRHGGVGMAVLISLAILFHSPQVFHFQRRRQIVFLGQDVLGHGVLCPLACVHKYSSRTDIGWRCLRGDAVDTGLQV